MLTGGGLLLYGAIEGRRKKVKEFLEDLADKTLHPQDIITLVEKIFREVSNQYKTRNTLHSPFSEGPAKTQAPIKLDIPQEEISLSLEDLGGLENLGEAATELASRTIEEVVGGIIGGIFDGI